MKTVYKYSLYHGLTNISAPGNAKPLSTGMQNGSVMLWMEVDVNNLLQIYNFHVVPTGGSVPQNGHYIGTAFDGMFVWHVYQTP
jgi:hypothetical protein